MCLVAHAANRERAAAWYYTIFSIWVQYILQMHTGGLQGG